MRLKEAKGGKVTIVSVGPDEAKVILKKCLAMGADEAVLIKNDTPETYSGLRIAKIISQTVKIKFQDYHILLFGKQSVGADNAQVPAMVAELLDLPQINVVTKLEIEGNRGTAYREIEGASEKVEFSIPAVISAQKGLNEPRYETLKGIMMAKKKDIPKYTIDELGLKDEELIPQFEITKMETPSPRQAGKIIEGEPDEAARKLVELLHTEAKII